MDLNLPDFNRYDALIFDMDGTLIDSMPANLEAWRLTAEAFNFPFDAEFIYHLSGQPSRQMAKAIAGKYGCDFDPAEVAQTKGKIYQSLGHACELIPCTYAVLKQMHPHKPCAIGTGAQRHNAMHLLKLKEVSHLFKAIVTSSDVSAYKPDPETFVLAAEQMGVKAQNCLVFEDTDLGLQAAHRAGMDCVWVEAGQLHFKPLQK